MQKIRIKKCFIIFRWFDVVWVKNIICFREDNILYKYSRECDGIVLRTEAEQNVNVASIVDRTTTSVNLLYNNNNNMILIISASSSIVLIRTAASYTIRVLSNPFDIFYCITLLNDILHTVSFFVHSVS